MQTVPTITATTELAAVRQDVSRATSSEIDAAHAALSERDGVLSTVVDLREELAVQTASTTTATTALACRSARGCPRCLVGERRCREAPCGRARARWCICYRCQSVRSTRSTYHLHDDRHYRHGSRSARGCPRHLVGERSRSGASCGRKRARS